MLDKVSVYNWNGVQIPVQYFDENGNAVPFTDISQLISDGNYFLGKFVANIEELEVPIPIPCEGMEPIYKSMAQDEVDSIQPLFEVFNPKHVIWSNMSIGLDKSKLYGFPIANVRQELLDLKDTIRSLLAGTNEEEGESSAEELQEQLQEEGASATTEVSNEVSSEQSQEAVSEEDGSNQEASTNDGLEMGSEGSINAQLDRQNVEQDVSNVVNEESEAEDEAEQDLESNQNNEDTLQETQGEENSEEEIPSNEQEKQSGEQVEEESVEDETNAEYSGADANHESTNESINQESDASDESLNQGQMSVNETSESNESQRQIVYPIALTDATEITVIDTLRRMKEDASVTYFKPRVFLYDDYIIPNLTREILAGIYTLAEDNRLHQCSDIVYSQCIRDIENYFNERLQSNISLKALFDCIPMMDMDTILHIYIQDISPNGLYEDMFFLLYVTMFAYRLENEDASDDKVACHLFLKMPEFSLRIEQAVFQENARKSDDDDDVDFSTELIKIQSILDSSKECILDLINESITKIPIVVEDKYLEGFDRLRYLCLTGLVGQSKFSITNKFLEDSGLGALTFCIKEASIEFGTLDGQPICMYALGHMLVNYQANITKYMQENFKSTKGDFSLNDIPKEVLFAGVGYNASLQYVKNSEVFRSATDLNKYNPLLTEDNLHLVPDSLVFVKYNGKVIPRPLGVIFYNKKTNDPAKGFIFLPAVGAYLKTITDKGVSFEGINFTIAPLANVKFGEEQIYGIACLGEINEYIKRTHPGMNKNVVLQQPPMTKEDLTHYKTNDILFKIANASGYGVVGTPNCTLGDIEAISVGFSAYFAKSL